MVMPYCRDEGGATVGGSDGRILMDDNEINEQEEKSPVTKLYWTNVIRLYDLYSQSTLTSSDSSQAQTTKIKVDCN